MKYIHSRVSIAPGQSIVVELDHAANVQVMDDANLARYRRGQTHKAYGGFAKRSPIVITPPGGLWNVAIDLGGARGSVRATVSVQ
jgi:hypothetical protein